MKAMYKNVNEKNIVVLNIVAGVIAVILFIIDSYREFNSIEIMMLMMKGYSIFYFLFVMVSVIVLFFCIDYVFIKRIKSKDCFKYFVVSCISMVSSLACLPIFINMFSFQDVSYLDTMIQVLSDHAEVMSLYPYALLFPIGCGAYSIYQLFFNKFKKQKQNKKTECEIIRTEEGIKTED